MGRTLRFFSASVILLASVVAARHAQCAPALERGAAITDPLSLRELDSRRFGLSHVMLPERSADAPLANSELFALPSMAPVRNALDDEFDKYIVRHKTR